MKTTNQIRTQIDNLKLRLMSMSGETSWNRFIKVAHLQRKYLMNIANHFGKVYGGQTWKEIGEISLPKEIYAK